MEEECAACTKLLRPQRRCAASSYSLSQPPPFRRPPLICPALPCPAAYRCCHRPQEGSTSKLLPDDGHVAHYAEDDFALAFARIENHYFQGRGFFERDDQLLADAAGALGPEIPVTIVSGRYDLVCPHESAYLLAQALPHANHVIVPDAGHSAWELGIQTALLDATDAYRPGGGSSGGDAAPAS